MIVAVDPGTRCVGVAVRWELGSISTFSLVACDGDLGERLRDLHGKVEALFARFHGPAVVLVEEGICRVAGRARNVVKPGLALAEARGIIMAAAWGRGWEVRRVGVQTWKRLLTAEEREMPKNARYVAHFNAKHGWRCASADETDAALMIRAVA